MTSHLSPTHYSLDSSVPQSQQAQLPPFSLPVRPPTDQEELIAAISVLKGSLCPLNVQKLQEAAHAILSRGQTVARAATRRLGEAPHAQSAIPEACHPLPIVTALVESLRSPWLTADRDSQFLVARVLRLFSELTLLLSKREPPLPIFSEDVQKLIAKDTGSLVLLIRNAESNKQSALKFELQCAKEACKCWKSDDDYLRRYGPRLFNTLIDIVSMEGIHDAIKELRSISAELHHESAAKWYRQVFSLSIIGGQATGDPQVFKLVHQRLIEPYKRMTALSGGSAERLSPQFLKDKKLLMAGVDLLADLSWRGTRLIQTRALKGHDEDGVHYPGLLDLAAMEAQKACSSLSRMVHTVSSKISKPTSEHLTDIRSHACGHLHALMQHPAPRRDHTTLSIAEESQQALSIRQSQDTSTNVQSLVRELLQTTPSAARRSYLPSQIPSLWQAAQTKDLDQLVPVLMDQLSQLKQKAEQCDQKLAVLAQRAVEPAHAEEESAIAEEERRRIEDRRVEYRALASRIEAALQSLAGTVTHQYASLEEGNRRIEDGMASVLARLDSPPQVIVHLASQSPSSPHVASQSGPRDSQTGLVPDQSPTRSSASSQPDLRLLSVNKLKRLALQGNPQAQHLLGQHYAKGELVSRDDREAFKWFSLAAKQRNPQALYQVGCCYLEGKGISQSPNQAIAYFQQGVAVNSASAMCQLAMCYQKGYGGITDHKEAFSLLSKASEMGLSLAHRLLGLCYEKGWGVERDEEGARACYERAFLAIDQESATGDPIFLYALGQCYHHGQGVSQNVQEAAHWYELAADDRYPPAQYALATLYQAGIIPQPPEKAIALFKLAAEAGYPEAQLDLGRCYQKGWGVKQSKREATIWYERAAKQGLPYAQYRMGRCCDQGIGVQPDHKRAVDWYMLAANQGLAKAQYRLGVCFQKGRGVTHNREQAISWYSLASKQGSIMAQCALGGCYIESGWGVEQASKQTLGWPQLVEWYACAAKQGSSEAQVSLGLCYDGGLGLKQDPQQAVEHYAQAAAKHHTAAQFLLGNHYLDGLGCEQNITKALDCYRAAAEQDHMIAQFLLAETLRKETEASPSSEASNWYVQAADQGCSKIHEWYRRAAEQGHAEAQYQTGLGYEKGSQISPAVLGCQVPMFPEAIHWYTQAAQQGHPGAQYRLGCYYDEGIGTYYPEEILLPREEQRSQFYKPKPQAPPDFPLCPRDYEKAVHWYSQAVKKDHPAAQAALGLCYEEGRGVAQDHGQAVYWYGLAAKQGDRRALGHLGYCYFYGLGVARDIKQAFRWLKLGAEKNDPKAQIHLGLCYQMPHCLGEEELGPEYKSMLSMRLADSPAYKAAFELFIKAKRYYSPQQYDIKWSIEASYQLGECYRLGRGVPTGPEAIDHLQYAAKRKHLEALVSLGAIHIPPSGGPWTPHFHQTIEHQSIEYFIANDRPYVNDLPIALKYYKLADQLGSPNLKETIRFIERKLHEKYG